jgi:hypothetical protein
MIGVCVGLPAAGNMLKQTWANNILCIGLFSALIKTVVSISKVFGVNAR